MDLSIYHTWVQLNTIRTEVAQALRKLRFVDTMFDEYAELDGVVPTFSVSQSVENLLHIYEEQIDELEDKMYEDTDTSEIQDAIALYEAAINLENAETGE